MVYKNYFQDENCRVNEKEKKPLLQFYLLLLPLFMALFNLVLSMDLIIFKLGCCLFSQDPEYYSL